MERIAVCHSVDNISLVSIQGPLNPSIVDFEGLSEENFSAAIVAPEFINEQTIEFIKKKNSTIPIVSSADYPHFLTINEQSSLETSFSEIRRNWIIENNFNLLENIFTEAKKLKSLWNTDRHSFIKNFFSLIQKNTQSQNIDIIFKDVFEKEEGKTQLIHSCASGDNADIQMATKAQSDLMAHYDSHFAYEFSLIENKDNKAVVTITIEKSPILIMCENAKWSLLQVSLLKSLAQGLN